MNQWSNYTVIIDREVFSTALGDNVYRGGENWYVHTERIRYGTTFEFVISPFTENENRIGEIWTNLRGRDEKIAAIFCQIQ